MGDKMEALKSEFRKIIWPDQKTMVRETTAVVVTGIILGVVLAILDTVIKVGLNFII